MCLRWHSAISLGFKLKWFPMLFNIQDVIGIERPAEYFAVHVYRWHRSPRFTRSEMLEVLGSDYMLLAESKGISGASLIFRHALRNALIPIITVLAPLIVDLMTGSLVVEKIFRHSGSRKSSELLRRSSPTTIMLSYH